MGQSKPGQGRRNATGKTTAKGSKGTTNRGRKPKSAAPKGKANANARAKATGRGRRLFWLAFKLGVALFLVLAVFIGLWAGYLNQKVVERFTGNLWALPASVYAAPTEIYVGEQLTPDELEATLQGLHYRARSSLKETGTYYRRGPDIRLHRRAFAFPDGYEQDKMVHVRFVGKTVRGVTGADGKDLGIVRLEPMLIGRFYPNRKEDRVLLKVEQVQEQVPLLIKTLLSVEDRDFYHHHGVVPTAVLRALITNLISGHTVQGGSTITQQLAKNLFLTPKRTYKRKLAEMIMALEMEWHYSKDKILEAYLNEVYLGQDGARAIHGFGLASSYYFGRPINELRPEEIALLVGMVKGASYYNPRRHPERAKNRRDTVIDVMATVGLISPTEAGKLKQRPLGVLAEPGTTAPHPAFLNLVKRQLLEQYNAEDLKTKGLRVFTTMVPRVQRALEKAVHVLGPIEKARHLKPDTLQTAGIVTSITTGEIQGLIGGRDPSYEGYNRALDARRQIGSLIKPAIYLTALSKPDKYSLITSLDDSPITIDQKGSEPWKPRNDDDQFVGPIPLYKALAESRNVPSVRLGMDVGLDNVAKTLEAIGGPKVDPFYPAMLLGSMTLSPFQVAQMYQTLSSDGFFTPLRAIRTVVDAQGKPLTRYPLSVRRVADPRSLYLLQYAMQDVVAEGTGKPLNKIIPPSVGVAGKTGTSNDGRDAWFAGFTGNRVGVVWVGRDDDKPTNLFGSQGALPVWADTFKQLYNQPRNMSPPKGVVFARVNADAQVQVPQDCPGQLVPFISGHLPPSSDSCNGPGTGVLDRVMNFLR